MPKQYKYFVYIMASSRGTIYVGVTNDLYERVTQHKDGVDEGFTSEYGCNKLVYFEEFSYVYNAIDREKQIKKWRREKKENLIRTLNPSWKDLSNEWIVK